MGFSGVIIKEIKHIMRDYQTLLILFILPLLQMIIFGYAMNLEIQNINLQIVDNDRSSLSRDLTERFEGSGSFTLIPESTQDAVIMFQKNLIHGRLVIPSGFAESILAGNAADLSLVIDGSDSSTAQIIRQYVSGIVNTFSSSGEGKSPMGIVPRYLYNSELNSAFFFVPGLTALLILMVTALLTSLTIAREKEQGTFELIKMSPLSSVEVILGKVLPYLFLSLVISVFCLGLGVFLFHVPIRGSLFSLALYLVLYCLCGLSLGIMISTVTSSQQAAMMVALMITLLPTLFLSGFIFALDSMLKPLQIISRIIPATYFLIIIRGLMLKGNIQQELLPHIISLALFSVVFLFIASVRFKAYLDN